MAVTDAPGGGAQLVLTFSTGRSRPRDVPGGVRAGGAAGLPLALDGTGA